jgi:hypothetical protein
LFRLTAGRRASLVIGLGLVAVAGALPGAVHTPAEFGFYYGIRLVEFAAVAAFCVWIARRNVLAYVLAAWTLALAQVAVGLFAQHNTRLAWHGAAVIAVMVGTLAWAAAPALRKPVRAVPAG